MLIAQRREVDERASTSIFPEYLRKIVIHAFSYLTMLTFAKGSNTSTTSAGIFPNLVQTLTDIHAKRSKPRTLIKGIKNTDDFRITFIRCHPTGAMTTVVTDIERLVSCRSRGYGQMEGQDKHNKYSLSAPASIRTGNGR